MWTPGEFEAYRALYPNTPPLDLPPPGPTARFREAWTTWDDATLDRRVRAALAGLTVVFVRGYLGNWMPGNLVGPTRSLVALGVDARLARTSTSDTVAGNVARLAAQLRGEGPLLLCGHSKGGLECLATADAHPGVAARLVGVVLSQTPRGASGVLESLLLRAHQDSIPGTGRRLEEAVQRVGLHAIGAARGGTQLTADGIRAVVDAIDARPRGYPVWQTASWSSQPTTWLDSFHGRLGEIRPGAAHDGQFFLEDLLWPGLDHVLLPHVDHAQPVMGGFGFDPARYWKIVLALFREAGGS